MTAKEMFEELGMELYSNNYLLFEFANDERKTYAYFDNENKSVETTYYLSDFETKEKLNLFKKAIKKFEQELGWLDD